MSKGNNTAEHNEYLRNLKRLEGEAKSSFEKAQVSFFDSLGTWLLKVSNTACDAKDSAEKAHEKIKVQTRGLKVAAGILGIIVVSLTIGSVLFNILFK